MDRFESALNAIIIDTYNNIMNVEENFLKKHKKINLSIREMHLLEYLGESRESGRTISEIAEHQHIAKPSVTVAVNKLEKKGFIEKHGSATDGRLVMVVLTKFGKAVAMYHHLYHVSMVRELEDGFDENEKEILIKAISKLNEFFKNSIGGPAE